MTTIHPAFKEDNVAVITGAASGIGLAAARKFAGFGMSVVLVDLDGEKLAAAHADILTVAKDGEAQIVAIPTDVSKLDELEALERAVIQRFGRVHVLMNNAGIQPGSAIFGPQANWEKIINVNLMGVVHGVRAFLPHIRAHGEGGHIVNTASMAGFLPGLGFSPYVASKFAVVGMRSSSSHWALA